MEEDSQSQLVKENDCLQGYLEQLLIQLTALQQGGGGNGRTDVANQAPQSGPLERIVAQEQEITWQRPLAASEEQFSKLDHGGKLVLELPQTSQGSH
jgi:hypothetical protein